MSTSQTFNVSFIRAGKYHAGQPVSTLQEARDTAPVVLDGCGEIDVFVHDCNGKIVDSFTVTPTGHKNHEQIKDVITHEERSDDPVIHMRSIRVCFAESQYNYQTNINGTRESIGRYFRGAPLNLGWGENDFIKTPCRIEFLPNDPAEPTIIMNLENAQ